MNFFRIAMAKSSTFTPTSNTYTTPGTQSVNVPAGATYVTMECIAGGSSGTVSTIGGGGGAYAAKNSFSVVGLATVFIQVGAGAATGNTKGTNSYVKETDTSGTIRCLAAASSASSSVGGLDSGCTGDVKHSGGDGFGGGGGAGGPTSAATNCTGETGTAGGGGSAGAGGNGLPGPGAPTAGSNYGGGGARSQDNFSAGAGGWVKLSWT